MSQYSTSIGKSAYEIPYDSNEDLLILKSICKDTNILVNSIISSNPVISNEFAILLALINIVYETKYSADSAKNPINEGENQGVNKELVRGVDDKEINFQDIKYSQDEVLQLIAYLQRHI